MTDAGGREGAGLRGGTRGAGEGRPRGRGAVRERAGGRVCDGLERRAIWNGLSRHGVSRAAWSCGVTLGAAGGCGVSYRGEYCGGAR